MLTDEIMEKLLITNQLTSLTSTTAGNNEAIIKMSITLLYDAETFNVNTEHN